MAQTIVLRNNPAYKEGSLLGYDLNSQSRFNPVPITLSRDSEAYVEKNGVLTRVNPDVPRIDSDGALLVEPQRTNLLERSEELDNAYWFKSSVVIVPNDITAPDGTLTADKVYPTSSGNTRGFRKDVGVTLNNHVASLFAKHDGGSIEILTLTRGSSPDISFNIATGQVVGTIPSGMEASIIPYNDGWYRCVVKYDSANTNQFYYWFLSDTANSFTVTANGTDGIYVWGTQLEEGSYATSYIKTEGATATRSADVVSQTGLANLLGDAEGSLYVEMQAFADYSANSSISLNDGSVLNTVRIRFSSSNNIEGGNLLSGATQSQITTSGVDIKTINKCAFRYSLNDFAFYVNGSQIGTDVSGGVYSDGTLTDLSFDRGGGGEPFYGRIKALAVYDTALDNTELANITTNGI